MTGFVPASGRGTMPPPLMASTVVGHDVFE
jgi:hypothetical protein